MLEVLEPGFLSTVQDGGRPAFTDLGVPVGGACDRWSLAVANLLLANPPDAAALEVTLSGPELRVLRRCVIGLAGADLGAHVVDEGRQIAPGTAHLVHAGTRIAFGAGGGGPGSGGGPEGGARAYLAVAGGIDVPPILGSRGTSLGGGFGGLDGRPLRHGDRIVGKRPDDVAAAGRRWPGRVAMTLPAGSIRLLPAPPTLARPVAGAFEALLGSRWRVAPASDRMGLRLEGRALPANLRTAGALPSRGVIPGAVQVPPGGAPIVLLMDAQTVGGYPVAGVVPTVDLPILGQLRPGAGFRFLATTLTDARAAQLAQRRDLAEAARLLANTEDWYAVADSMA
jgi:5-oxoprolinase (ATP-hydrolysing) subunit C